MNNSIIITSFTLDGAKSFNIAAGNAKSVEDAQAQFNDMGVGIAEIVLGCIQMDLNDAGIRAIAAVLELAVDAHPASSIGTVPVPAEALLLDIFKAGVEYGQKTGDPFKYGLAPDADPADQ